VGTAGKDQWRKGARALGLVIGKYKHLALLGLFGYRYFVFGGPRFGVQYIYDWSWVFDYSNAADSNVRVYCLELDHAKLL
jgi:hypothetical protein